MFQPWKMRVKNRSSMAVIIRLVNVEQRGGYQCKQHCTYRYTGAESMHGHTFSCAEDEQVNGKASVLASHLMAQEE
jgi:hypothetical protein